MVIYTMCVNPESGRYIAISTDDPDRRVIAASEAEAIGLLVESQPGIKVDNVCRIDTTEFVKGRDSI